MIVGQTIQLEVEADDAYGEPVTTPPTIAWSTGDATVATVDATGLLTAVAPGQTTVKAQCAGVTASATLSVQTAAAGVPATVSIQPGSVSLAIVNHTQQLTAVVRDNTGAILNGVTLVWNSSDPAHISVDQNGLVTALATGGNAVVSAVVPGTGAIGNCSVTTPPTAVTTIALSPTGPLSLQVNGSQQIVATVQDQFGATLSGQTVVWSSNDPSHISVSQTGLAIALATGGNATITAAVGSVTATIGITTPLAVPTSIVITPTGPINLSTTLQASAAVLDQFGAPMPGQPIAWSSTDPSHATVSSTGLITAVTGGGTVSISASDGALVAHLIVTTTVAAANVITLSPAGPITLPNLTPATIVAVVKDQFGTVIPNPAIVWTSSNPAGISVSSSGVLQANLAGQTATITAQVGTATATLTASTNAAAPTSITLSPTTVTGNAGAGAQQEAPTTLDQYANLFGAAAAAAAVVVTPQGPIPLTALNATRQLAAVVQDQYGDTLAGQTITWSSNNPTAISVSVAGLVTALKTGQAAVITASNGTLSGTVTVTTPATVASSVVVTPSTLDIPNLTPIALSVSVLDQWGAVMGGQPISWSSTDPADISVDASGNVSAHNSSALALIIATSGNLTGSCTATTDAPAPGSVVLVPSSISGPGDGGTVTLVPTTLDQYGHIYGGSPTPTTIQVTPATPTLVGVGTTQQLTATVLDQVGQPIPGQTVSWVSSNPAAATVSNTGLVTTVAGGSTTITASLAAISGTATVAVRVVTTVTVAPTTAALSTVGSGTQLSVTVKDQNGAAIAGQAVSWSSSAAGVATVSGSGLVTEVAAGSATITASCAGVTGTCAVTCTSGASARLTKHALAGMTLHTFRDETALVQDSWHDQSANINGGQNESIVVNPTGMPEGTHAYRVKYPAGLLSGDTPVDQFKTALAANTYKTYYVSFDIRYMPGWVSDDSGVGKIVFVTDDSGPGNSEAPAYYLSSQAGGGSSHQLTPQLRPQTGEGFFTPQAPNQGTAAQQGYDADGTWHTWAVLLQQNTPGNADGSVQIWLDDVLITDRQGINWHPGSAVQRHFVGIQLRPYWGGNSGKTLSAAQFMELGPLVAMVK